MGEVKWEVIKFIIIQANYTYTIKALMLLDKKDYPWKIEMINIITNGLNV